MPLFTAEIPETHLRINRPVIKQVVDDILLRFKDIPFREFRFLGDSSQLLTPGSATDAGAFNRSDADNYVNIEVTDEPDEEFGRSYVVTENQNKALISCKRTMMDMYPIYQNRKINIRLEVVCSSRVRLNGLITRIRQCMHQSETLFTHQISYDYDLPVPCAELLNQIYHLMESNHGYGIDFVDWLREIKQEHVQMSARLDGQKGVLTIRENAVNVLSNMVEHEEEPKKEKEKENGVWSIDFDVELRYQRPNVIRCSYPPIVHGEFLPEMWFNKNKTFMFRNHTATSSLATMVIEKFKWDLAFSSPGRGGLGIKEPYFDDWGKEIHNKKLLKLVTSLSVYDANQPRQFFNLRDDLVDYKLPEEFLAAITKYPQALAFEGKHIINVKAYKGNDTLPEECLTIDENLNITLDHDMDPRGYYHIIICFNTDPTTIPDIVWDDLLCSHEALQTYFSYFGDKYKEILEQVIAQFDDESFCLTRDIINEVIREIIIDGKDSNFDNSQIFYDEFSRRTKVGFSVIGERI